MGTEVNTDLPKWSYHGGKKSLISQPQKPGTALILSPWGIIQYLCTCVREFIGITYMDTGNPT